jgi:hypothetical protein
MAEPTDEEKIEEVRQLAQRIKERDEQNDKDKARLRELIPQVVPKPSEPPIRGRLTEVVKATGWTREYVARIRDGKVKGA